jgi:hypothetical protein
MANTYKSEYEFYPSESKHEGDCHRYCGDYKGLSDQDLSSIELRQHPYVRDQYSVSLVFSTGQDKRDMRAETVKGLLQENAGITDAKVNSHGNSSGFSVVIDNLKQEDLMRVTVALTQTAPKGNSDHHYAVLGQDIAEQVMANELHRLKLTPVEAGLVSISIDQMTPDRAKEMGLEKPVNYVDVDLSAYPLSPVTLMREEGAFSEKSGATAMRVETRLGVRDGQATKVVQALQSAGIIANKLGQTKDVSANAPTDVVASALQKAGLMAPVLADAIKSAAESAHPGQQKINAEIDAQSTQRLKKMSSGAKLGV